ncbi:hypothetical protein [Thalassobellus suaedae]|uniref:Uncharacterized protein n=1 Tax=Thalassobellus suaedae TaxID=3074124 RepID=A0ABY9XYY1_9FLAO|nr:hypothetical protein RHP49_09555 [Flavobacteriaceae bacterium HL-DH10]
MPFFNMPMPMCLAKVIANTTFFDSQNNTQTSNTFIGKSVFHLTEGVAQFSTST